LVEKGKEKINEILKKKEEKEGIFDEILDFTINLLKAPFSPPKFKEKKKEEAQQMTLFQLDPISRLQIEKIIEKTSKIGFQCGIRVGYFAKKDIFKKLAGSRIPLIYSIFKSFENTHLNSFSDVKEVRTRAYYYFVERREFQKKRNLYYYLRYFFWTQKKFILNIEEINISISLSKDKIYRKRNKKNNIKTTSPTIKFTLYIIKI
jgi:hypothetical protein